jgi:hypothetical protein
MRVRRCRCSVGRNVQVVAEIKPRSRVLISIVLSNANKKGTGHEMDLLTKFWLNISSLKSRKRNAWPLGQKPTLVVIYLLLEFLGVECLTSLKRSEHASSVQMLPS